ncbi:MAG: hypothetical protein R3284_05345 [Rubricoccaceae bacterium]|nr:hypothetical protein [Rubricoccaceae bacterium]
MRLFRLFILLSLLVPYWANAQNVPITALPFLEIPPSPGINALGGAGVALSTSDPHAFLYNPAQLGIAARETRAAGTLYPGGSIDWLAVGDLSVGSTALTAGVDFRDSGLPLAAGVGLAQTALHFGDRIFVNDEGEAVDSYEPLDRYYALSLGAATTGPLRLGIGSTVRHISTTDRVTFDGETASATTLSGFSFDVGALAQADITSLFGNPLLGTASPRVVASVGYSQSNIGGTISYSNQGTSSPMPRTARLGWSLSAGFDMPLDDQTLRFLQGDFSVQAEHLLVREERRGSYTYEPFLGNLDIVRNGFLGRGDDTITARKGLRISLIETLSISRGQFDGWGFDDVETTGVEFHLAGPLKILASILEDNRIAAFAQTYDVRFTHTSYFSREANESSFNGLTFVVKR